MMFASRACTLAVVVTATGLGHGCATKNDSANAEQGQDGDDTGAGSASADDDGTTAADGGASVSASASDTSTGQADDGEDDGPLPIKLDVSGIPDSPEQQCEGNGGKGGGGGVSPPDFSFIWIANSTQSTVSKINTETLVEEGRYMTRENSTGDPSRTSVSLNGDVAIANRNGGVLKIYARLEDCDDPGNTSEGPGDVKDFPDGCVAWYTPFVYQSQRPVAWTPGEWDGNQCRWVNEKLWTSGANASIDVILIDGDSGEVEQTIPIPGVQPSFYGIYGAASDADGNFWGSQLGIGHLVRVDRDNFDVETHPMAMNGYGMTVDQQGRAYTCSGSGAAQFDPDSGSWNQTVGVQGGGGCMVDAEGRLWMGNYTPQLVAVDIETMDQLLTIPIPQYTHGISIDWQGNVWGVSMSTSAYRVNPEDGTVDTVNGLVGPYTYSDMTGWALGNAVGPPPSG
jgi:hypothetical protein